MKRIVLSAVLLSTLALPALAGTDMASGKDMKQVSSSQVSPSDAGFYIAAYGGADFDTWYGDKKQTVSAGGTTLTTKNEINDNWGAVGGIKAGYNFNSFAVGNMWGLRLQPAVEAEALYIGDNNNSATGLFGAPLNEKFSTNSGDFFLNGILRFKNESIVTPYIGAGVGLQYITTTGQLSVPSGGPGGVVNNLNTSDVDFAGQALFGLDVSVCQHISVFTEYKFIDAIGTDGKSTNFPGGITYRFKPDQVEQNLITAGVKYTF
jgi:outer membrane protein W